MSVESKETNWFDWTVIRIRLTLHKYISLYIHGDKYKTEQMKRVQMYKIFHQNQWDFLCYLRYPNRTSSAECHLPHFRCCIHFFNKCHLLFFCRKKKKIQQLLPLINRLLQQFHYYTTRCGRFIFLHITFSFLQLIFHQFRFIKSWSKICIGHLLYCNLFKFWRWWNKKKKKRNECLGFNRASAMNEFIETKNWNAILCSVVLTVHWTVIAVSIFEDRNILFCFFFIYHCGVAKRWNIILTFVENEQLYRKKNFISIIHHQRDKIEVNIVLFLFWRNNICYSSNTSNSSD